VNIETRVAAIQIVAALGIKVARQLLFLEFTLADDVPPRHFVTQLEKRNEFFGAKGMVTDDVVLLDLRRNALLEHTYK
ncbi:hypothetical protein AIZ12_25775, partial [Salmonella enterica subsp. enterica serovar Typhimurium]